MKQVVVEHSSELVHDLLKLPLGRTGGEAS